MRRHLPLIGVTALLVTTAAVPRANDTLDATPRLALVGRQTAGADGEVSVIALPASVQTCFSGLGVYFPDGRNTQRIGVPDVEVHPTIAGIQNGVDEVRQRAIALVR